MNDQGSQKWKETSTTKKLGIAVTSLAALTALGALYAGPEKLQEQYNEVAFSVVKSATTTKPLGEWIKGYSDFNELSRLASLSADASCAEILYTCELDPDDKQHKSVYRSKAKKFHPDHHLGKDTHKLAVAAEAVLGIANRAIKNGTCSGQDEGLCAVKDIDQTLTHTLKQPHWIFEKIMRESTACFLSLEDGAPVRVSLDECQHL